MKTHLLTTKIRVPSLGSIHVPRSGLRRALGQGMEPKLTLVSAPAGFGKSTAVAEIVRTGEAAAVAWISLDERDADVRRFLAYVSFAFAESGAVSTETGDGIRNVLESPEAPPTYDILTTLVNETAEVESPVVIVLDDLHRVENDEVMDAVAFLLDHSADTVRMFCITREDPPLPLARLRAQGKLAELRAADLQFTGKEVAQYCELAVDRPLDTGELEVLERRSEGWPAGPAARGADSAERLGSGGEFFW